MDSFSAHVFPFCFFVSLLTKFLAVVAIHHGRRGGVAEMQGGGELRASGAGTVGNPASTQCTVRVPLAHGTSVDLFSRVYVYP
jgi:hypothetical protein